MDHYAWRYTMKHETEGLHEQKGRTEQVSQFQRACSQICTCCQLPSSGHFTVGKIYAFKYIIDAQQVMDEEEEWVTLCDQAFDSCFEDITEVTTSFCPMSFDKTIYHIYLILDEDSNNRKEIKACAKVLNINYLKAREKLNHKRCLLTSGEAGMIQGVLEKLSAFDVHYEIEPPYPY